MPIPAGDTHAGKLILGVPDGCTNPTIQAEIVIIKPSKKTTTVSWVVPD